MKVAETKEVNVNEVSRQAIDPVVVAQVCEKLGIVLKDTDLEIRNEKKEVLKKVTFKKPVFEDGDKPAAERFQAAVEFLETVQPPQTDKEGKVTRVNNPLDILLSHLSYSFDLTQRNGIRSKESILIAGPDKEMEKQAKKIAAAKGITFEAALERVKLAWE
jgi:hypothetical protein